MSGAVCKNVRLQKNKGYSMRIFLEVKLSSKQLLTEDVAIHVKRIWEFLRVEMRWLASLQPQVLMSIQVGRIKQLPFKTLSHMTLASHVVDYSDSSFLV